jgi:hypothetical protein
MTVQIIKNFISKDYAKEIVEKCEPMLVQSQARPHFFESFPNFIPVPIEEIDYLFLEKELGFLDTEDKIRAAALISNAMYLVKLRLEEFYNVKLEKHAGGIAKIIAGGSNGLHSDMYMLDGSAWNDGTGREDEMEYSALLYLSDHGEDFSGGEIGFPQHDLIIAPNSGDLVFFRGDLDHVHEVKEIISGNRYALIMFFGK